MTPEVKQALEGLARRALSASEEEQIDAHLGARRDDLIAQILSVGRTRVEPTLLSARGLAARMPGGPIAAEIVLTKLEGARDAMLSSTDQQQRLLGSMLRRQLAFLSGDGIDIGSPVARQMLDQFAALGVLTLDEAAAVKALAVVDDPVSVNQVSDTLNAVL